MKHTRESVEILINEATGTYGEIIDLSGQDLSGLNLCNLDFSGVDFEDANLLGADLSWSDFEGASLQGADLRRANLRGANLRGAYLQDANLRGANLRGADLDLVGFMLSCRTIGIKVDGRLISQLLYHLCSMNVENCPGWDELRNDERVIALANQSHVITKHELPEID